MGKLARQAKLPYLAPMDTYLRVSAKGRITLEKAVLAHLGVQPGQKLAIDRLPGGSVLLYPAPTGKISDVFGMLKTPARGWSPSKR